MLIWEDQMLLCLNLQLCRIFYVVLLFGQEAQENSPFCPWSQRSSCPVWDVPTLWAPGKVKLSHIPQGSSHTLSSQPLHWAVLNRSFPCTPYVLFTAIPCTYLPSQAVLCSETSSVIKPRLHFRSICKKKPKLAPSAALVLFRGSILQQLFSDERFRHSHGRQIDSWTPAIAMTSTGCILHYAAGNF